MLIDRVIEFGGRAFWRALLLCCVAAIVVLGLAGPAAAQDATTAANQQFVFAYRLLQGGEDRLAAQAFDEYLAKFTTDARRADGLYYRAYLARKADDNKTASRLLADAGEPTIVPAYALQMLRGQVFIDLGQYREAIAALETIKLEKADALVRASSLQLRGLAYRGAGNLEAAARALAEASQIDSPLRARSLLDLARVEAMAGDARKAVGTLDKVIGLGDGATIPEAALLKGDLLDRAGDFGQAIAAYRIVITDHQSSPQFPAAVVGMMWARLAALDFDGILSDHKQFSEVLPDQQRGVAAYLAGSAAQEKGDHSKAIAFFAQAQTAGPETGVQDKAIYKTAVSYFRLQQYEAVNQAIVRLNRTFPDSPHNLDALLLLATAEARSGNLPRGVALLDVAIQRGEDHAFFAPALLQRAKLLAAAGQARQAADDYQRYLTLGDKLTPESRNAATLALIDLLRQLDKLDEAAALAQEMLKLKDLPVEMRGQALYRQAAVQFAQGSDRAAIETAATYLKEFPQGAHSMEVLYMHGRAQLQLGQIDQGLTSLGKVAQAAGAPVPLRADALRRVSIQHRTGSDAASHAAAAEALEALHRLTQAAPQNAGTDPAESSTTGLSPRERLWLAEYALNQQQPKDARAWLAPLVEALPAFDMPRDIRAGALVLQGRAHRMEGDAGAAMTALQAAIAIGDTHTGLRGRLEIGRVLASDEKLTEALAEWESLISASQSAVAAEASFESGLVQRRMARKRTLASDITGAEAANREAQRLFKRVTLLYSHPQLSPLPELAHVEAAEVALAMGANDSARGEYEQLVQRYGQSAYGKYAQAMLLLGQNKRGDAVFLLKQLGDQKLDPRLESRVSAQIKSLGGGA